MVKIKYKFATLENFKPGDNIDLHELKNIVIIDEDFIIYLSNYLKNLKTFDSSFNTTYGLNTQKLTIISPRSAMFLYDMVTTANQFRKSSDLSELAFLLLSSKMNEKYIIFFSH